MNNLIDLIGYIINVTLFYTMPLLYAGLGSCICEASGIVNIGIEGTMTIGAFVGCSVAFFTGNPWLAFIIAGLAGLLLSSLHAIACLYFNADQTISGTAINMLGSGISVMGAYTIFGSTDTKPLSIVQKIPILFQNIFDEDDTIGWFFTNIFTTYATTYLAITLTLIIFFVFYKTRFGMRLRACGEHPKACETLGINVIKARLICVLISGFLSGLGGACITLAVSNQFRPISVVGQGFIAIAAVIFGKYKPAGTLLGCLLFGFCSGMKIVLSDTNISSHLLSMIPYIITLLVLMIFAKESSVPKASGKPYIRGM